MENPEISKKKRVQPETVQRDSDDMRLLKIGLRDHDPEMVGIAMTRISDRYGEKVTEEVLSRTINTLMDKEDWSWQLENGEASPLI